ncbi:hypothetical protein BFJ72_g14482 [Fusarium proliferatum]|uniref:CWF21 domain-containing protein n=1 Tax=Gibberella intermedia TaxID=948311 RepID=A0A420S2N2_GIBIN|nr:hypothetical protein BFJ72_g14482 [Fusarium proliferatum]
MSDNVGLNTPRGSGTSGYVQRNLAQIKPRDYGAPYPKDLDSLRHKQRQPDKGILEHDRKREVEVKVFDLRDKLEEEEVDEDEIDRRCDELRQKLLTEMNSGRRGGQRKTFKQHQVHEMADAKIKESERLRKALKISADYEEGGHWKRQEERLRNALEKEEEKDEDSDRERRLRSSEFERARVASNLEYARNSLTKLEHDALGIKAPGRRAEVQSDLNRKRELLELLLDRLEDLRQVAIEEDEDDESTDGEDILSEIIPTPSDSMVDSISTGQPTESSGQDDDAESEPPEATTIPVTTATVPAPASTTPPDTSTTSQEHKQQPTQTTQNLRSRGAPSSPSPPAHSTARAALFANRSKPSTPQTSTATAEALLDHQRAEQEALSESILQMASALKSSSQRFSTTLEADKDVVARAGEGMDKTERSMEAAKGRMGMLKRMTEGKGYFGRLLLYAYIALLAVACILVVFVLPKLRF